MSNNPNSDNNFVSKSHPVFSKSNIPPPIYSVVGAIVGYKLRHVPPPGVIFFGFTSSYIIHSFYCVTKSLIKVKDNK